MTYRPGLEEFTLNQIRLLFRAILQIEGLMVDVIYNLPDNKRRDDALASFQKLAATTQEILDQNSKRD